MSLWWFDHIAVQLFNTTEKKTTMQTHLLHRHKFLVNFLKLQFTSL